MKTNAIINIMKEGDNIITDYIYIYSLIDIRSELEQKEIVRDGKMEWNGSIFGRRIRYE